MKNSYSFFSLIIILFVFCFIRIQYKKPVTTWDSLGYYMYLPATFIYHDLKNISFYDSI
jgi:hypothetical protein